MLIDWFTVIAQLINFVILLLLLKRFLYGPILKAVDAREKRIADQIKDAEEKEIQANKDRDEYIRKNEEFDSHYNEMMSKAIKEANERKAELMEKARGESVSLRTRMLESFESEKKSLAADIMEKTQNEVFSISRKVMRELSTISLEEQIIEVFIEKLNSLDEEERKKLVENKTTERHEFQVNTSFEISETLRNRVENLLRQIASGMVDDRRKSGIKIEFGQLPGVISGIELIASGYKLAWSISDYIGSMEKHVSDLLKEKLEGNHSE